MFLVQSTIPLSFCWHNSCYVHISYSKNFLCKGVLKILMLIVYEYALNKLHFLRFHQVLFFALTYIEDHIVFGCLFYIYKKKTTFSLFNKNEYEKNDFGLS